MRACHPPKSSTWLSSPRPAPSPAPAPAPAPRPPPEPQPWHRTAFRGRIRPTATQMHSPSCAAIVAWDRRCYRGTPFGAWRRPPKPPRARHRRRKPRHTAAWALTTLPARLGLRPAASLFPAQRPWASNGHSQREQQPLGLAKRPCAPRHCPPLCQRPHPPRLCHQRARCSCKAWASMRNQPMGTCHDHGAGGCHRLRGSGRPLQGRACHARRQCRPAWRRHMQLTRLCCGTAQTRAVFCRCPHVTPFFCRRHRRQSSERELSQDKIPGRASKGF
mmetsp:Transcript_109452/g.308836  ORF Transcript_109452/g.308836 Transcript_109452/m.308836 type:complete len:275 (-) Transcript_109452:680-1504(-)